METWRAFGSPASILTIGRHERLGEHIFRPEVRHMCPDCGNPPNLFCATCYGAGDISEARLAQWQREVMAREPR